MPAFQAVLGSLFPECLGVSWDRAGHRGDHKIHKACFRSIAGLLAHQVSSLRAKDSISLTEPGSGVALFWLLSSLVHWGLIGIQERRALSEHKERRVLIFWLRNM